MLYGARVIEDSVVDGGRIIVLSDKEGMSNVGEYFPLREGGRCYLRLDRSLDMLLGERKGRVTLVSKLYSSNFNFIFPEECYCVYYLIGDNWVFGIDFRDDDVRVLQ